MQRRELLVLLAASATGLPIHEALAQPQAIRLLVGATPGGGTDLVARSMALEMTRTLGRQFIVDNRPGAAGNIAAQATASAAPDGSTLLLSYTSHAINATLYPNLPFDPVKDFTPLYGVASAPAVLVTRPNLPAKDIKELIALAKAQPGKLNIAIAGIGSANHLAGEMLKRSAGIDIVSIPYKGTGPALADVMAGQIDLVFSGVASAQELIKGGKLKALGVSSGKRLPLYPDWPAISEVLPGFEYSAWYGLFGPAHMPPALVQQYAKAAREALESATVQKRLASESLVPMNLPPAEFDKFVRSEIVRWGKVVTATGAKPE
ncbi:tripartite tricarboxylate transporter substrate binding protein [Xylophilus rhododendri]|uniref:Tripartite tricarboxylate transporter substrate binding protein n=1 Tax=Xylophilus rhododendri TaxID=2697032 RepID=A0A857JB88_9BURK|nr:tripartite tricarboxylate transporter substrate binding protein [Xylophilus rhododendri]QHJ00474.1 tripartite tricarboxylate transporter substrate binding protein [Xylophilus rhododendri]